MNNTLNTNTSPSAHFHFDVYQLLIVVVAAIIATSLS